MNKFKIGDIIRSIDNFYKIISIDNEWVGIVTRVDDDVISAKTIYCKKLYVNGFDLFDLFYKHFELLNKSEYKKYRINDFAKKHFQDFINENKELFKNFDVKFEITEKPQILDEKEKEYLSAVIKPFRDRVKYILKERYLIRKYDCITINISSIMSDISANITFPFFNQNTMYKGMEVDRKYTLEELGI